MAGWYYRGELERRDDSVTDDQLEKVAEGLRQHGHATAAGGWIVFKLPVEAESEEGATDAGVLLVDSVADRVVAWPKLRRAKAYAERRPAGG
jgi:hypothetical protein